MYEFNFYFVYLSVRNCFLFIKRFLVIKTLNYHLFEFFFKLSRKIQLFTSSCPAFPAPASGNPNFGAPKCQGRTN